jgi:hypothetical protein
LDSAIALMETHRRLSAGTNSPKAVTAGVAPHATKEASK